MVSAHPQWVLMALSNVHLAQQPEARPVAGALGLTPTLAQVAAMLSTGMDLSGIVARVGLEVATMRNN